MHEQHLTENKLVERKDDAKEVADIAASELSTLGTSSTNRHKKVGKKKSKHMKTEGDSSATMIEEQESRRQSPSPTERTSSGNEATIAEDIADKIPRKKKSGSKSKKSRKHGHKKTKKVKSGSGDEGLTGMAPKKIRKCVKTTKKKKTTVRNNSMGSEGEATLATVATNDSGGSLSVVEAPSSVISPDLIGSIVDAKADRHVAFDTVHVDEYEYSLGTSHVTKLGPPVTISTIPTSSNSYHIDVFEKARSSSRRGDDELFLTTRRRIEILLAQGFSLDEIQDAVNDSERIRNQRKRSVLNQQYDGLAETKERISRKVGKWTNPKTLLTRAAGGTSSQRLVTAY